MLTEVADDKEGAGFVPVEVDGHTFLRIASTKGDVLGKEVRHALVVEAVVISVTPYHCIGDVGFI